MDAFEVHVFTFLCRFTFFLLLFCLFALSKASKWSRSYSVRKSLALLWTSHTHNRFPCEYWQTQLMYCCLLFIFNVMAFLSRIQMCRKGYFFSHTLNLNSKKKKKQKTHRPFCMVSWISRRASHTMRMQTSWAHKMIQNLNVEPISDNTIRFRKCREWEKDWEREKNVKQNQNQNISAAWRESCFWHPFLIIS